MLEYNVNNAIKLIIQCLNSLKLSIASEKCLALVFGKKKPLKWSPIFKIHGKSISVKKELNYLGIIFDECLTWLPHLRYVREKVIGLGYRVGMVSGASWGVSKAIIKEWYRAVVVSIARYGAPTWGARMNSNIKNLLFSIQRVYLLKVTSAYKTTSNNALCTLTSCPPLFLIINDTVRNFNVFKQHDSTFLPPSFSGYTIPRTVPFYLSDPAHRIPPVFSLVPASSLSIFTDGSKISNNVGCAFCCYEEGHIIYKRLFQLGHHNSVFQAELTAISGALKWLISVSSKAIVHTDSLSALKAIYSTSSKLDIIHEIRNLLFILGSRVQIIWVKAHVGIEGNEMADALAKEATSCGNIISVPFSHASYQSTLKLSLLSSWQDHWRNADTARNVFMYIPKVSTRRLVTHRSIVLFLTEHGPCPLYKTRFGFSESDECICGDVGSMDHYIFDCPHTRLYHLVRPSIEARGLWLNNILKNKVLLSKFDECVRIATDISRRILPHPQAPHIPT